MDVLIHLIRSDFEREARADASPEEVEAFVRRAFQSRNIVPTDELVQQVVDHLTTGAPVAHLKSVTVRHCGQ